MPLGRWLEDSFQDVRYATRSLRHQTGFAVVAVLTLTLGIGANTTIFSMVNAVLLRPLPVREPGRLVLFSDDVSQGTVSSKPFPDRVWSLFSTEVYDHLRTSLAARISIAAFESGDYVGSLRLPASQVTSRVDVDFVSGNFFETMGVDPVLGRPLGLNDDVPGAAPVAVASDRFWRERLNADAHAIGRVIDIDDVPFTIVGIAPASFFGVRVQRAPDVWVSIGQRQPAVRDRQDLYWLSLIARLSRGQTRETAQMAVNTSLHQFLSAQVPAPVTDQTRQRIDSVQVAMADGSRGISLARQQNTRLLLMLLSAVGLILCIACANVGTLFVARAASREREVAVRRALGASVGRLIRQWLTESALLAGAGACCGLLLARLIAPRLLATFVHGTSMMNARVDATVLAFTVAVSITACLLFGLAPALSVARVDPADPLRHVGRLVRRRRAFGLAEPFVVAQVAISLVLVVAATLLTRTLLNLQQYPFGFEQNRVLLVQLNPRTAGYRTGTVAPLYRRIYERLAALPGVERVTFARYAPFSGSQSSHTATIPGYTPGPGERLELETILAGPDYPQTLGMPLLRGRAFTLDDDSAAPRVAMVNEAFATRFFPGGDPIGHRVELGSGSEWRFEIVGVSRDAYFRNAREAVRPSVFIPMLQEPSARILDCEFELRTKGDASALTASVRRAIESVDPKVGIGRTRTLREQVVSTFGPERTAATFIASFAVLAVLVASVGLYGVVSFGVNRRTNEIGIRMALGAARGNIVRLIARETTMRLGLGLLIGFILARITGGLLAAQLFGVTPGDPVSALIAALVLSLVVALTTIRPLQRAMRTDPVAALRAE